MKEFRKTPTMQLLEIKHGQDILTICKGALVKAQSVRGAARLLKLSHQTFRNWLAALEIDADAVLSGAVSGMVSAGVAEVGG